MEFFEGRITYWDDTMIASLNPSTTLPHEKIVLVDRSDDSGVNSVLTGVLSSLSSNFSSRVGQSSSQPSWCMGRNPYPLSSSSLTCKTEWGENMTVVSGRGGEEVGGLVLETNFYWLFFFSHFIPPCFSSGFIWELHSPLIRQGVCGFFK